MNDWYSQRVAKNDNMCFSVVYPSNEVDICC